MKSIMAKFSALAIFLQSSRQTMSTHDKDEDEDDPGDTKEMKDIKVCVF